MSTQAVELVDLNFCHVHGRAHPVEQAWAICRVERWSDVVVGEVSSDSEAPQEPEQATLVLSPGDLAYIDTVQSGLVPCKVLFINRDGITTIQVTAYRGDWKRGESVPLANPRLSLVKREQVSTNGDTTTITGAHLLLATEEGVLI